MSNKPTHHAYVVSKTNKGADEKSHWTRIGAVWPHSRGEGFDLVVAEGIAASGRIVCLPPKAGEE